MTPNTYQNVGGDAIDIFNTESVRSMGYSQNRVINTVTSDLSIPIYFHAAVNYDLHMDIESIRHNIQNR